MKTTHSLMTLTASMLSLFLANGCGNADAPAPAPALAPPDRNASLATTPTALSVESALADVDTGRDPAATRARLEALLADPLVVKEQRASVDVALARLLTGKENERAIALLEDATALGDEGAEKKLFALLAGHEPPSPYRRVPDDTVADSARALAKFFPPATADNKVEIDLVVFGGQTQITSENLGTFAIAEALRENAMDACGLCDEVTTKTHTHSSRERNWSAIPRYQGRLENAVVVIYVSEETLVPERYAKYLAAPVADVRAAVTRGEGLIAVKERAGAPPIVTIAAPRAAQFTAVETAFAKMSELPKEPVRMKLPDNLSVPEVQSGVRARFGGFKACYNALLGRRPSAAGKIDMAFTITGAGKLAEPVISFEGTLEEPEHRACVEKVVASIRYPAWSKAPNAKITVRYPVVFHP